jgi:predicted  nucleic acid-binding Zn-ribbon protein
MAEHWTLERMPRELQAAMDELKTQVARLARDVARLREEKNKISKNYLRRKEFMAAYHISSSTLDRRVRDGSIEKDLSLGDGSPRYRLAGRIE